LTGYFSRSGQGLSPPSMWMQCAGQAVSHMKHATQIYRGVHRLNRDEQGRVACVACFMCETACPAHCIHIEGGESPWPDREKYPVKFDIDELRCIYCGMCEEACPVDAIELTPEYSIVGLTRDEMIFDKEKLLEMFDRTRGIKPRSNPKITGYPVGGPIPPSDDERTGAPAPGGKDQK
jgi:formate hydrogenlyase subunit 6/NADH:ubiquinone oxidoreductase subunit I